MSTTACQHDDKTLTQTFWGVRLGLTHRRARVLFSLICDEGGRAGLRWARLFWALVGHAL